MSSVKKPITVSTSSDSQQARYARKKSVDGADGADAADGADEADVDPVVLMPNVGTKRTPRHLIWPGQNLR